MTRKVRTDKLTEDTAREVAYLVHELIAADDPERRRRFAELLFKNLPIDQAARDHGAELAREIQEYRRRKQRRQPQPAAVRADDLHERNLEALRTMRDMLREMQDAPQDAPPAQPATTDNHTALDDLRTQLDDAINQDARTFVKRTLASVLAWN